LGRTGNAAEVSAGRLKRLAHYIDALAAKDEESLGLSRQIDDVRRTAASELYTICRDFVNAVNRLLSNGEVLLDPTEFSGAVLEEDAVNLIQISVRGRILQVAFNATHELLSTEDFRIPYTLAGSVRAFSQILLDKEVIDEQLVFYTVEKDRKMWRFFDPRTYRSGTLDQDYLISVMERLV
jgi:hypothetical protein